MKRGRIAIEPAEDVLLHAIGDGLRAYNIEAGGAPPKPEMFVVTLRDASGALLGGVTCDLYLGGLLIEWAWIDADHRGQGHGRAMVEAAEAEGARRGAAFAHLDTFSFQARGFYESCGYQIFGELDYPGGIVRFYMQKTSLLRQ